MFGAGLALGFVLGSKSGRSAYESLKTKSEELWRNPTVQEKVHEATDAVKEKAPGVASQVTDAAKKAGSAAAAKLPGSHGSDKDDAEASSGVTTVVSSTESDPATNTQTGQSWTGEGGAAPGAPATGSGDDLRPPGP